MTKTRHRKWIARGLMGLALFWTSGCAYIDEPGGGPPPGGWHPPGPPGGWHPPGPPVEPPPGRPPRPPQARGGYVGTERASWQVWHNVMPGPRAATLHIEGVVTVSASNFDADLRRRPSPPDVLHYDVRVNRTGDFGAQVLTRRQVRFAAPYGGNHEHLTLHFPDGERIRLRITRAH